MNETTGKSNMSLLQIESYAMHSSTYVHNDSHVFTITLDRKTEWTNNGGGWSDYRTKTKVASNNAYKEWMMDFVPPNDLDKCGINFGYNGVCQTYANRELLVGQSNVDVSAAPKNFVSVFFFGKYGLGLSQLKTLLTQSYNRVTASYSDPYNALNPVLARVDNCLDDELNAWRKVGIEYGHIPVDEILAKNPSAGLAEAKRRISVYIKDREAVYQQYLSRQITTKEALRAALKAKITAHTNDYLQFLANYRYITDTQKNTYKQNIANFISGFSLALEQQSDIVERTGVLDLSLLDK